MSAGTLSRLQIETAERRSQAMVGTSRARWIALALAAASCGTALAAESRTWTDKSGKFTITAELIAVQDGNVVLRQADGSQLTIPIKRLSAADRDLVEGKSGDKPERGAKRTSNRPDAAIAEVAEQFLSALRGEKRDAAAESLTKKRRRLPKATSRRLPSSRRRTRATARSASAGPSSTGKWRKFPCKFAPPAKCTRPSSIFARKTMGGGSLP